MSTHCRNILLREQKFVAPVAPPEPPGQVVDPAADTPGTSGSGEVTVTFFSPVGAPIGTLNYNMILTGGPYTTIEVVSITPVA